MYLAYSALPTEEPGDNETKNNMMTREFQERFDAYREVCHKFRHEIAEIQRFLPGWMPSLPSRCGK